MRPYQIKIFSGIVAALGVAMILAAFLPTEIRHVPTNTTLTYREGWQQGFRFMELGFGIFTSAIGYLFFMRKPQVRWIAAACLTAINLCFSPISGASALETILTQLGVLIGLIYTYKAAAFIRYFQSDEPIQPPPPNRNRCPGLLRRRPSGSGET